MVDANGLPVRLALSAGQEHDSVAAIHLLDGMSANCLLLADRAYDSDAIREFVGTQGAWANIPPKKNRKTAITLNDSSIASSIAGE